MQDKVKCAYQYGDLYCVYNAHLETGVPLRLYSAGIFKQSMGSRNRVEIGLLYRPTRLHSLADLVPLNRFLGSLKV